ncbi:MAG: DUF1826 domain-containing protein [Sphingomonas phyllosphaerae]
MNLDTMARDVAVGAQVEVLEGIGHEDTALAIWERPALPALHAALTLLDLDAVDDVVAEIATNAALDDLLRAAGYPEAVVDAIAADIVLLAHHHAELTDADRLSLKLEVVETDACRRFHADYVTLRMLCTYVGPGTQWQRVADPDTIGQVPTGAVAVFKGRLLLDPPAVLHRSPPIIASGERRLLLAIDPA